MSNRVKKNPRTRLSAQILIIIGFINSPGWHLDRRLIVRRNHGLEAFGMVQAVSNRLLLQCIGNGRLRRELPRSNQRLEIEIW
jgi:hypothetical protein